MISWQDSTLEEDHHLMHLLLHHQPLLVKVYLELTRATLIKEQDLQQHRHPTILHRSLIVLQPRSKWQRVQLHLFSVLLLKILIAWLSNQMEEMEMVSDCSKASSPQALSGDR